MKISTSNLGIYSISNSLVKTSFGCKDCKRTMGIKDKLPNTALYADINRFDLDYDKRQALCDEYFNKIMSVCHDENGNLDSRLKDYLDNTKFEIADKNGIKRMMTVKEAIEGSILRSYDIDIPLFHATYTKEIGEQIIKNGFDPNKISRTQFGPGFYFSGSEGAAMQYNSAVLVADCKGKCAHVDGPYFDRITDSGIYGKLAEFIELPMQEYGFGTVGHDVCRKLLFEYTRNMIVNELGYDMAYGSSRVDSCYAIYNPKAISNIKFR